MRNELGQVPREDPRSGIHWEIAEIVAGAVHLVGKLTTKKIVIPPGVQERSKAAFLKKAEELRASQTEAST